MVKNWCLCVCEAVPGKMLMEVLKFQEICMDCNKVYTIVTEFSKFY